MDLEHKMAQMNMSVEYKVIHALTTPNIFIQCVILDVPWIQDSEGDLIGSMKLYPLKIIVPLLFVFGVKDKEVNKVIDVSINCIS